MTLALTVFQGRVGDHNDRGFGGASAIGAEWQRWLGLTAATVGTPEAPLNNGWHAELIAATPTLEEMSHRYDAIYSAGQTPVSALTRCAVALATLPVVARYHPDALVVWFDAHGDLNTPESTTTDYLGGLALSGPVGMWESGLGSGIAAANVVLGGARELDPFERRLIDEGVVRHVPVGPNMLEDLDTAVGDRPVYFHLDCDVLEPGLVPTDYRVPNGLSLDELSGVASRLAENAVVGVEVAEFEGSWSDTGAPGDPGPLLTALSPLVGGLTPNRPAVASGGVRFGHGFCERKSRPDHRRRQRCWSGSCSAPARQGRQGGADRPRRGAAQGGGDATR